MPDPAAINSMFARIARRYDVANRLLSGGADVWWRKSLVRAVALTKPDTVLDVATGSGDVAFALSRKLPSQTRITGMDFCQPMLDEAIIKQQTAGCYDNISFVPGDGLALPLHDASYDVATIAFGLRNMADRARSLREMYRVLRPEGHLFVLEFSQPHHWFRPVYLYYLRHLLPLLATAVTQDRLAYEYLCGSIKSYPDHHTISREILDAGFNRIDVRRMTFGVVALHQAVKIS